MTNIVRAVVYCKKCGTIVGTARREHQVDIHLNKPCPHKETKDKDWQLIVPNDQTGFQAFLDRSSDPNKN